MVRAATLRFAAGVVLCGVSLGSAVAQSGAAPGQSIPAARTSTGEPVAVRAPSAFLDACARYDWLCAGSAPGRLIDPAEMLGLARSVNRRVNLVTTQVTDAENYGLVEYWTLPRRGRGDCEDYVLAKYRLLLEAGIDSRNLAVAIALDRFGSNHAVLVLRHPSGDLILDNLLSDVSPWHETGYRFLAMQREDDKRGWIAAAPPPEAVAPAAGLALHRPGGAAAADISPRAAERDRQLMARGG